MQHVTRSRLIQLYLSAVALVVVLGAALGVSMTVATAVVLIGMILVPPAIMLALWPGPQPPTVAEVLRER